MLSIPPSRAWSQLHSSITFEVLRSAFDAAAGEMGVALRKAAYSTNIKTRADFSCALFDANLRLIAQSFSQPVHLASMSRMVPSAIRQYGVENLAPGDAVVMFTPIYHGGDLLGVMADPFDVSSERSDFSLQASQAHLELRRQNGLAIVLGRWGCGHRRGTGFLHRKRHRFHDLWRRDHLDVHGAGGPEAGVSKV